MVQCHYFIAATLPTPFSLTAELLRENKRTIDRAIRELDRERMALQTQEKKTVIEIKKMAKEGQMGAVKVMAQSVVRNRNAVTKLYQLKSQLQSVSLRMSELKSTQAMTEAMAGTTKAMAQMNRKMNLPAIAKIMREFERQNMKMEQTSEMMGDAVDMTLSGEGEEEETEELVSQVLDEIGIDATTLMVKPPGQQVPAQGLGAEEQPAAAMPVGAAAAHGGSSSGARRPPGGGGSNHGGGGGGGMPPLPANGGGPALGGVGGGSSGGLDDDLQARLDNLRKG